MSIRHDTPLKALRDQALTAGVENANDEKPDSSSPEELEAQSMSYRRSRNLALMKLAFLRPHDDEAAWLENSKPNEADLSRG
ncbi:MAG: hypothetical protein JO025_25525 [Verrucomicrobia bacterium]|nr:hypothetical protein [Verrucomicrobiota bacterium]